MRILMIGWEFPPVYSGGLGTHIYHLTKNLAKQGVEIVYVMPLHEFPVSVEWMEIINIPLTTEIGPYVEFYEFHGGSDELELRYPRDLIKGAHDYADKVIQTVLKYVREKGVRFDLIHCHDWITMIAGMRLKELLGIPLVVTVHATELSRTAGRPYHKIVEIERECMKKADLIIANSNFTKKEIVDFLYGDPKKIRVVYNAVDHERFDAVDVDFFDKKDRIVLFLGRLTFQKGPEFFIRAAKKVLEVEKNVKFIVAGKGFLLPAAVQEAISLGIADKIFFLGYVPDEDVPKLYKIADVYVMPSVYEPFGITALEAMACGTPVIVSKSSGVTEVVKHVLTVDFWDVHDIATKIISVLRYRPLKKCLSRNGYRESKKFSWDSIARDTLRVYEEVVSCRV